MTTLLTELEQRHRELIALGAYGQAERLQRDMTRLEVLKEAWKKERKPEKVEKTP